MDYNDSVHLDPELTWEDAAHALFHGIKEGKLTEEDVLQFIKIGAEESYEPRITRIFAKALSTFFLAKNKAEPLKDGETAGVLVEVDDKQWIVAQRGDKIVVNGPANLKAPDRSLLIMYDSEADAKIGAWQKGEEFIQEG